MKRYIINSLVMADEPVSLANAQDILTSPEQPFKWKIGRTDKESNRLPVDGFLNEFHARNRRLI